MMWEGWTYALREGEGAGSGQQQNKGQDLVQSRPPGDTKGERETGEVNAVRPSPCCFWIQITETTRFKL